MTESRLWKIVAGSLLLLSLAFAAPAFAGYPEKPVTLMIPYGGGGTTDVCARLLANLAQKDFAKPIVIANKPGGGGVLMHELLAQAKPDGYTLGVVATGVLTRTPFLRKVRYDPEKDFTYILLFALWQYGLVVQADSPWQTLDEFLDYAKANPGKVTYSTAGTGSAQYLAMEYLAQQKGIQWTHIPFKGGISAVTALLGGHVTACAQAMEWKPYVETGKLRLLAVLGGQRIPAFPKVPTLKELGYDYEVVSGPGLAGPAGLPPEVVSYVTKAFTKASHQKEFLDLLNKLEMVPYSLDGAQFGQYVTKEIPKKRKLVNSLGLGYKSK
ncbi:MAG: tripartite tricarboxylate transporter substrate binding protein [Desulfarculaceae bacterium]|nr:tripartite tricarboxylate transporter substrate binding protein [Desulfarculaceae bacterium]MCF8049076.1 tripartite tricarboxylate transporter substrate binding protein [Desulfarculaceae bacterium]MCF8065223.1 tripartite tricarboxylate transporter substrate binding protein [Desulfarculaceae bacterium]MCF8099486.1 tripartite tricarboxylate transporter substrate binding protein [Desulfarculaceae bacterium]